MRRKCYKVRMITYIYSMMTFSAKIHNNAPLFVLSLSRYSLEANNTKTLFCHVAFGIVQAIICLQDPYSYYAPTKLKMATTVRI